MLNDDERYCWACGGTGEVREQPFDDLSGYVECSCVYGSCGCGCCDAVEEDYDDEPSEGRGLSH